MSLKKFKKDAIGLAGAGITIGVASNVMSSTGASAVPMSNLSKALPIAGNMMAFGLVTEYTKKLQKQVKR